ncbi:MAG: 1-deoxy-D-xylulose-5-phosphate synthase [Clostridiales bacterium]|nr:1-deoxy-D-xylulose-5-phosphate synthase [Clostridiales bacterium]
MSDIVDRITDPSKVADLSDEDKDKLAAEIREMIIQNVSKNGGHLSSNLGVVELTIALLSCFHPPEDQIVFDVGHQCYPYKILTGRSESFCTLRQINGLSGFPLPSESEYDCFGTGHSSTSISAALGLLRAKKISGADGRVIAVIGDGALSGGMAYEALNDAGQYGENLIVILNDNQMSIDRNVGAISRHLNDLRSTSAYLRAKSKTEHLLNRTPLIGKPISRFLIFLKDSIRLVVHRKNPVIFENLGFRYYGPFDGHDIHTLIKKIRTVQDLDEPILIHVCTRKGKGYEYAEEMPAQYHGVAPFDIEIGCDHGAAESFTGAFSSSIVRIAEQNDKVVAISAGMMSSSGLDAFQKRFPERFFDVGIAEEHAVTLSAGLSANGMVPILVLYSTFLQRGYDQVLHDICLQNLHVVIAIDRAGIVGADGPTHQGIYDVAMLCPMPNIEILAPRDYEDLDYLLDYAVNQADGPVAVRYPRANEHMIEDAEHLKNTQSQYLTRGKDVVIFSAGVMTPEAYQAVRVLQQEGISCDLVDLRRIKPLDEKMIVEASSDKRLIVCCEEAVDHCGLAAQIIAILSENSIMGKQIGIAVSAKDLVIGTRNEVLRIQKLDFMSIAQRIKSALSDRSEITRNDS